MCLDSEVKEKYSVDIDTLKKHQRYSRFALVHSIIIRDKALHLALSG